MERKSVLVLKIGGSILDDAAMLNACLTQFALLPQPKILVHGGGAIATKIGAQMGIGARYHNGRRITDAPTLDLVTMVYAGLLNKQVVAQLQSLGCNAFGCTGADGNLIVANKRAASPIDFGFVGDIADGAANISLINTLFKADITPVFAPITHDGYGQLLNTNADSIAQALAVSLQQDFDVSLIYGFEKKGVLLNKNDEESFLRQLTVKQYKTMIAQGAITDGMLPKLNNAFAASAKGVQRVIIGNALALAEILNGDSGTIVDSNA